MVPDAYWCVWVKIRYPKLGVGEHTTTGGWSFSGDVNRRDESTGELTSQSTFLEVLTAGISSNSCLTLPKLWGPRQALVALYTLLGEQAYGDAFVRFAKAAIIDTCFLVPAGERSQAAGVPVWAREDRQQLQLAVDHHGETAASGTFVSNWADFLLKTNCILSSIMLYLYMWHCGMCPFRFPFSDSKKVRWEAGQRL